MSKSLELKLTHLEMLYSEQDHTIQTLNEIVAQQDQEISQLNVSIEQIRIQLQALKSDLGSDTSAEIEKPPHY